jgi:uncharacterized protein
MVFADTGAWFAAFVPNDPDHPATAAWLSANRVPLVTTDWVVDELLTLLRVRGKGQQALRLGEALLGEQIAELHWVTRDEVLAAWELYRRFAGKHWSFTDCVSKIVMERLGISTAFAFAAHFRQFGTATVVR